MSYVLGGGSSTYIIGAAAKSGVITPIYGSDYPSFNTAYIYTYGRISGGVSSFGSFLTSASGVIMGFGKTSSGGAGGWLPGVSIWGGDGVTGTNQPSGLAGVGGDGVTSTSPFANTVSAGSGNCGSIGSSPGAGGNGYGAGAGSPNSITLTGNWPTNSNTPTQTLSMVSSGGDAGQIVFGSFSLSSTGSIPVTVGNGGQSEFVTVPTSTATTSSANGTMRYVQSGCTKGADGCVAVFW